MSLTTALWFIAGLVILLIATQALAAPLEVLLKFGVSSVTGGSALWLIDLLGTYTGFHLALNPGSAMVTGVLGVPGLVGLGLARLFLG